MISGTRAFLGVAALATVALWAGGSTARAQSAAGTALKEDVDLIYGEEPSIKAREEWFFSTRRAGATKPLVELRSAAVEVTRKQLQLQAALGLDKGKNVWTSRGPGATHFGNWSFGDVSGRIPAIAKDWTNNILYAGGASGGLWKSTNDGVTWTSIFDGTGTTTIGSIALDPNNPNTIWVGTGENTTGCEDYFGIGLLRSTDGGQTWQNRSAAPENLTYFGGLVVDPRDSNHLVVGGRYSCVGGGFYYGGIFTTNDAGATWTNRLGDVVVNSIVQDPTNRNIFWAGVGSGANNAGGIYRSTDNGVSWVRQTVSSLPTGSLGRIEVTVSPADGNYVYALFSSVSGNPQFWRTTNGGTTWSMTSSGTTACDGQCDYNMVIRAHVTEVNTVFRGNLHVFKSTDGGTSWSDLTGNWGGSQKVHQDTHYFLMNPTNANEFYVGCDGGLWKTGDGGVNFSNLNTNLVMTQFYAIGNHPTDDNVIVGGCQDNSSQVRTTSDKWDMQAVTGDGLVSLINPVTPSTVYIASYPSGGYPNVMRSTTGVLGPFSTITGAGSGIAQNDRIGWLAPYIMDPSNPSVMYLGTHHAYKSTDGGTSWNAVGPADMTNGGYAVLSAIEVNRGNPAYVYAGSSDGKVWQSNNSGASWTDISAGLPARSINDLGADPSSPGHLFAVVGGFNTAHVWEYNGGGWTARDSGMPNLPTNTVLMLNSNEIYVGNDVAIYRSTDGGVAFAPYMNGLPLGVPYTDLKFTPATGTITAGTYGRGAWQNTVPTGAQPNVRFDSVQAPMVQVSGDGDANVEPGEIWKLKSLLRDDGLTDALNVTADLTTSTPGVRILGSPTRSYGTVPSGTSVPAADDYTFQVDPSFACGGSITFNVVNIKSTNAPSTYPNQLAAFTVPVIDHYGTPAPQTLLNDTFDPAPGANWSHGSFDPGVCTGKTYLDEWKLASKDAGHGSSWHAGNGPGHLYSRLDSAWLYYGGKDSANGPGLQIPATATSATLTFDQWFATRLNWDGGQVLVDGDPNHSDSYTLLTPNGGYTGALWSGYCNALQGQPAWNGTSGGWISSTVDLSTYQGKKIYLAFAFGTMDFDACCEGWYVDNVKVVAEVPPPVCNVSNWPGEVPSMTLQRSGPDLVATWSPSCNASVLPGQNYSLEVGDLATLAASGTYTHAPLASVCSRMSPFSFTPGPGSEYYLVVPNASGLEGSAGQRSNGAPRPQVSAACGTPAVGACP